jgi:hypothetical protein
MKKTTALLAGLLALSAHTHGAIIIHTTNFDNTFDSSVSAPFVGSASFSYNRSSALADGFYTFTYLNSFSPVFSASFNNAQTFSLSDLVSDPTQTGVYLSGSNFILAGTSGYGGPMGGTADFVVGGDENAALPYLTSEKIWVDHLGSKFYSSFRNTAVDYALFIEGSSALDPNGSRNYGGNYGFDISAINGASSGGGGDPAAVPEPGTWAAAALLVGGAAFMRWRKRAKVA